jgi:hypothetical protein
VPNQAENDALQQLVVEVAVNKAEARAKVARLKEKYNHLLKKVGRSSCPDNVQGCSLLMQSGGPVVSVQMCSTS